MKFFRQALLDGAFLLDLKAHDIESILHQTLNHVVALGKLPAERREEVEAHLTKRETVAPTAIGHSVSIPHAYSDAFTEPVVVFVRLARPLQLGAPDGIPTRFLFALLGPSGGATEHLDTMAAIARLMSDVEFRYEAGQVQTHLQLLDALKRFEERSTPEIPLAPKEASSLTYSRKLCSGFVTDLKRRLPHYLSDFRDGLHPKTVSSTLFLFFACFAPAVTFGGIMAELTDSHIGAVEMIIASGFCGIAYALFSGHPLIILGGTGPLLIFTVIFYGLCQDFNIEFLPALAWAGLWAGLFLVILSVTNASCLLRFFTRFTDEIFAALISIIFIHKAIEAISKNFFDGYLNYQQSHDEALVPLLLAIGTFYIALSLSRVRRSRYLLPQIREFLSDFGPSISLCAMLGIALLWFHDVSFPTLPAPDSFRPTLAERSWYVDIMAVEPWVRFATIIPALLATVLIFLDQNITAHLVNSPDHPLQKGEAYHYDLALVGILIAICSLFGLPWLVAATVRSLNHVRSLATLEEVVTANGETRERIIHIRETRLSGLFIHILIASSLLLLPYLQLVPMAVLYGLFLYMGIVSLSGNQFFERLHLWIMDRSLYPVTHYTRQVPIWTIHSFTFIQAICLAVLILVEVSPLGILFPLFIGLLVPVRFLLDKFFRAEHLEALDAAEIPYEEDMQWD